MDDLPEFLPRPVPPKLPGAVVWRETQDDVLDAAAADLFIQAKNCVRAFGDFHLAVSVNDATEPLLRRLMYDPGMRDLPWKRTHLWIADERALSPADERSRFGQLKQLVIDPSDIPAEQAHAIDGLADAADRIYEAQLREHLAWREKGHDRLDCVLLGLGAEGGIAGLAPGEPDADHSRLAVKSGTTDAARSAVTLTLSMINAARLVSVMATGPDRREIIRRLVRGPGPAASPARKLAPLAGELRWYLDQDATPTE